MRGGGGGEVCAEQRWWNHRGPLGRWAKAGDTKGALTGEDGGRGGGRGGGGGKGGGRWSGHAGGGGGCPGHAVPFIGERQPGRGRGLNGPAIVLVGSRGEGAREPGLGRSCHLKVKEFWVSSAGRTGRDPRVKVPSWKGSVQHDLSEPHAGHSLPPLRLQVEQLAPAGWPKALACRNTLASGETSPAELPDCSCGTGCLLYPTSPSDQIGLP